MTVWDEAVPELERAGYKRELYIFLACDRAYEACVEQYPVLERLRKRLMAIDLGIGRGSAIKLIAAIGVLLHQSENGLRR